MSLDDKDCVPCEEGGEPMEYSEIEEFLDKIDSDWQPRNDKRIFRQFDFMDFADALEFVNEVGDIAHKS